MINYVWDLLNIEVGDQTQWITGYVCLNLRAEKTNRGKESVLTTLREQSTNEESIGLGYNPGEYQHLMCGQNKIEKKQEACRTMSRNCYKRLGSKT